MKTLKTYKDVYEFPLKLVKSVSYIWDNKNQMVAQFETYNEEIQTNIMNILNNKSDKKSDKTFIHKDGLITCENHPIILIRGWGNLTGIGGHHLSSEEALNIQNTFAEFIIDKLNKNK